MVKYDQALILENNHSIYSRELTKSEEQEKKTRCEYL